MSNITKFSFGEVVEDAQLYILSFLKTDFIFTTIRRISKFFSSISLNSIVHEKGVYIKLKSIHDLSIIPNSIFRLSKKLVITYNPNTHEKLNIGFPIVLKFFNEIPKNKLRSITIPMSLFNPRFKMDQLVKVFSSFRVLETLILKHHRVSEFQSLMAVMEYFDNPSKLKKLSFSSTVMDDIFQNVGKGKESMKKCLNLYFEKPEYQNLECLNISGAHTVTQMSTVKFGTFCERNTQMKEVRVVLTKKKSSIKKLASLHHLVNLKRLNIIQCVTCKEIKCEELEGLKFDKLEIINLKNSFGVIDGYLSLVSNLSKLIIEKSRVSFPEAVSNLKGLKVFKYHYSAEIFFPPRHSKLVKEIPREVDVTEFSMLENLQELSIDFSKQVTLKGVKSFGKLTNMKYLMLAGLKMGNLPLKGLTKLRKAKFVRCSFEEKHRGVFFSEIASVQYIKCTTIEGSSITFSNSALLDKVVFRNILGKGLDVSFKGKKYEEVLDIFFEKNNFELGENSELLRSLSSFSLVRRINLNGNVITSFPVELLKLPFLEELNLEDNKINTSIPESEDGLRNLKILDLNGNPIYSKLQSFSSIVDEEYKSTIVQTVKRLDFFKKKKDVTNYVYLDKVVQLKDFENLTLFCVRKNSFAVGSVLKVFFYSLLLKKGLILGIRKKLAVDFFWTKNIGGIDNAPKIMYYCHGNESLFEYLKNKKEKKWICNESGEFVDLPKVFKLNVDDYNKEFKKKFEQKFLKPITEIEFGK